MCDSGNSITNYKNVIIILDIPYYIREITDDINVFNSFYEEYNNITLFCKINIYCINGFCII